MATKEFICPKCFYPEHTGPCLSAQEKADIERELQAQQAAARMIAEMENDK
jgi:hypothetical protein